jgi:preprotein translocase subunit SecY
LTPGLVILTINASSRSITKGSSSKVALAQNTAGFSLLAWLIVALLAAVFIFGLIFYVRRMRRDRPTKEPDRGGFDR